MENSLQDYTQIKGWNSDADPRNEPTYPMKHYNGDDHKRRNYDRPDQQPLTVEVLHSNERPNYTAVFGASVPPSGLSGAIRRYAFRFSESSYLHWLPLLIADRINVIEALVTEIKGGKIPNIFAEKGWKAEWEYNKKGVLRKVLVVAAASFLFTLYLRRQRNKRKLLR